MKYIRLQTKEQFKEAREKYKKESNLCWKMYMWDTFRGDTCYILSEKCFISLDRALELGYVESI